MDNKDIIIKELKQAWSNFIFRPDVQNCIARKNAKRMSRLLVAAIAFYLKSKGLRELYYSMRERKALGFKTQEQIKSIENINTLENIFIMAITEEFNRID